LNFRDPFLASVSAGAFFAPGWGTLLTLSGGTPVLDGYDAPLTLGAAVSRLTGGTIVGVNGAVGLTETAPDLILGFSWRVPLQDLKVGARLKAVFKENLTPPISFAFTIRPEVAGAGVPLTGNSNPRNRFAHVRLHHQGTSQG
jgi:hypothetical protein